MHVAVLPSPPALPHYRHFLYDFLAREYNARFYVAEDRAYRNLPNDGIDDEWCVNYLDIKEVLGFGPILGWPVGDAVSRILKSGPAAIIVWANIRQPIVHSLLYRCKMRGIPIIGWNQLARAGTSMCLAKCKAPWFAMFDGFIFYNDDEVKEYRKCLGSTSNRVCATNNSLNRHEMYGDNEICKLSHDRYACGCFVFCARLEPKNRLDVLLNAYAQYLNGGGSRKLMIVGEGTMSDFCRCSIESLGLRDAVVMLGRLVGDELCTVLARAYAMVHPMAIGLSINTAFQNGLPLVASSQRSHHMPEFWIWKNSITGYGAPLVSRNVQYSAMMLSDCMNKMDCLSIRQYTVMSLYCKNAVRRFCDPAVTKERFASLINSAICGKS